MNLSLGKKFRNFPPIFDENDHGPKIFCKGQANGAYVHVRNCCFLADFSRKFIGYFH